jgi:hypothetical protein
LNLFPQRQYIQTVLAQAKSPSLLCSFGKDSQLLQHLAREVKPDIPIYYFGDELPEFAGQFILDNDLTVYNYAPVDRYLVPNGEGIALVDEYSLGKVRLPMLSAVIKGDACQHGVSEQRTPYFRFPHDVVFYGYKHEETMPAVGISFEKEVQIGDLQLVAPLYEMTDADVFEALEYLEISYADDSDETEFCEECLDAIIHSDWDRQAALANFRTRFQLNH